MGATQSASTVDFGGTRISLIFAFALTRLCSSVLSTFVSTKWTFSPTLTVISCGRMFVAVNVISNVSAKPEAALLDAALDAAEDDAALEDEDALVAAGATLDETALDDALDEAGGTAVGAGGALHPAMIPTSANAPITINICFIITNLQRMGGMTADWTVIPFLHVTLL